jgi:hypothetical protein
MYSWIWRTLPGRTPMKLLASLVLVLGVVALLFFVVFPVVEVHLPNAQVNVGK